MGFNTLPFVFVFLPLFLAAFYLVPPLAAACCAWGAWCSTSSACGSGPGAWLRCWVWRFWCICWACGCGPGEPGTAGAGLAALFGCLFFFKYAGLLGLGVTLPLAISFYSFQLAAYLIDVYRAGPGGKKAPAVFHRRAAVSQAAVRPADGPSVPA